MIDAGGGYATLSLPTYSVLYTVLRTYDQTLLQGTVHTTTCERLFVSDVCMFVHTYFVAYSLPSGTRSGFKEGKGLLASSVPLGQSQGM